MSTPTTSRPVPGAPTTESTAAPSGRRPNRFGPAPKLLATSLIGFVLLVATTLGLLAVSGVELLSAATPTKFASVVGLVSGRGVVYLLAMCWGCCRVW